MASRPYSSATQVVDSIVLDVQERRRSQKRGKEGRGGGVDNDESPGDDASLPRAHRNLKTPGMALSAVDELEGRDRKSTLNRAVSIKTTRDDQPVANVAPADAPDPAFMSQALAAGKVEDFHANRMRGWAWNPERPGEPVHVEILADDVIVLKVCANLLRDDLPELQSGDRYHGFVVENIEAHIPPDTQTICVRRTSDGVEIPGSPISIRRSNRAADKAEGNAEADGAERNAAIPDEIIADEIDLDTTRQRASQTTVQSRPGDVSTGMVEGTAIVAVPDPRFGDGQHRSH